MKKYVSIICLVFFFGSIVMAQEETVPIYVEQALHDVWSQVPELATAPTTPDFWEVEVYPPTSNSSLGCPSVLGTPLDVAVIPYRVTLYFGDTIYVLHVSEWGEYVVPCSPNLATPNVDYPLCEDAPPPRLSVPMRARVTAGLPNNLRANAGLNYWRVGLIPALDEFTVINGPICNDSYYWYEVDYNGQRGWTAEGVIGDYWLEPVPQQTTPLVNTGETITHSSLGFSIDVPGTWEVEETPSGMILTQDVFRLRITNVPPSGLPAGERITMTGFTIRAGIGIRRDNLVYQNATKAVIYQYQGLDLIPIGSEDLFIMLDTTMLNYDDIDLPETILNSIDQIVATLDSA